MSCICQYYTPGVDRPMPDPNTSPSTDDSPSSESHNPTIDADNEEESNTKISVSASDLADSRAENWLLRKKLREYEVTIENLEQLVTTIVEKQHQILSEMFNLRKENRELHSECHLQREYHSMERNALMRELHDVRTMSRNISLAPESSNDQNEKPVCTSESEDEEQSDFICNTHEKRRADADEDFSAASSAQSSGRSSPLSETSESEVTDSDGEDEDHDYESNEDSSNSNSESD
ncbi:hypothetical protein KR009_009024 [Drosophila setifemur]|nr:hypothetical protein KR009_009024 [Drosophila setifemur]